MLQRACQMGIQMNVYQLQAASREAHLEIVRWLLRDTNACDTLTTSFWQPTFGGLFLRGYRQTQCGFAFECAAIGGSVEILCLLKNHRMSLGWNNSGADVCLAAATHGHLAALKWARAEGAYWGDNTFAAAAQGGHRHILQYMIQQKAPHDEQVCSMTAARGDLDTLRWLLEEHNFPCGVQTFASATSAGHLHIIQYLHQLGCIWPGDVLSNAARSGNVDLLQWMVTTNNDLHIDPNICQSAAVSGNVQMLEYCMSTFNAKLNSTVADAAADRGHLHVLAWLHEHAGPISNSTCTLAAVSGHLEILKWTRQHGFTPSALACTLARNHSIREWLHANNCRCSHAETVVATLKSQ